jgi:hypothetical protein
MATWEGDYRESFTVTAMVSLTSAQPCWVSPPRGGTNDQWDFFRVIVWLLADGALQEGDFLVLDWTMLAYTTLWIPGPLLTTYYGFTAFNCVFFQPTAPNLTHVSLCLPM